MFLRELFEAPAKKAVLAFGRLNPPTIGHSKLVDQIKKHDGDHYLFLSQTQKPKTDPLDFATKLKFAKKFFPGINVGHQSVRTPVQALEMLQGLGYTDLIFVAGSDRVEGFQTMFDTYNGKPDKSGKIPFEFNTLKVVSAGACDPDAEGAEGMSASKMRLAAAEGNLEAFTQGVPDPKLAQTMYDAVRNGMGIKDKEPATEGIRPEKPNKSSEELIAMGYDPDSDKVQSAREYEDWVDDQRAKGKDIDEGDLVVNKASLRSFLTKMIQDAIEKEEDIDKLSRVLKMLVGKEIKTRGDRAYTITDEDINEILGFVTKTPKRTTVTKKRPPEEDSVKDKIAARRKAAAKGDKDAWTSKFSKS